MEVCDRCTIIRKGKGIGTVDVANTDENKLAELMVGRQVNFKTEKIDAKPKEEVLSIANLVVHDARQLPAVKGLDLTVRAGKLLGLQGLMETDKVN